MVVNCACTETTACRSVKQFREQLNRNTLPTGETNMSLSSGRTDKKQNMGTVQRHSCLVFSHILGTSTSDSNMVLSLNVSSQWSQEFRPLCFPYPDSPDSQSHVLSRTKQINNRRDGDLQSLWPASSENVLINLLLLHCGHCLWDWTSPHSSRKQQTNVCTD